MNKQSAWSKIKGWSLFLPVMSLLLVMAVNIIHDVAAGANPLSFFMITLRQTTGNGTILYGRIIDILNRGSEVAILAIGMTLVVSSSAGTDISVGSVMSLCASFCCMLLAGYGVSSTTTLAVPLAAHFGKKTTYMLSFASLIVLSIAFFYIPVSGSGYWWMLVLQVLISICTGVLFPMVWSMYADVSDYAENRDGSASTGLIFSSSSMAQKFGGAFGGAAVMWLLAAFGYDTTAGAVQTPEALNGLKLLMSWIPAAVAALAVVVVSFYPLTRSRMELIQKELAGKRGLS